MLHALLASPVGRLYRSISKRKVTIRGRSVILGLIDPDETATGGIFPVTACAIEPRSHQDVYQRIIAGSALPVLRSLFPALRYVIVRGDEHETLVILSVTETSPSILKAATSLSKTLTAAPSVVRAVYLHEDNGDGRYYLGSGDPAGRLAVRKLYGVKGLKHEVAGRRFFYPAASFSQVNHTVLDAMTGIMRPLLQHEGAETLLDLYCGYGLFGLLFAESFKYVIGADISPDAISAAKDNAAHQQITNVRFVRSTLNEDSVDALLRRCRPPFSAILDPPRGGTPEAMLALIASFAPTRVVHLFCNIERMPAELNTWRRNGYDICAAVPVDMFPGTASLEFVIGLMRGSEEKSMLQGGKPLERDIENRKL